MTGQGSGGMNPTPFEYLTMRTREFYHQQFLSHLARTDPRANTLTTALLSQMGNMQQQQQVLRTFGGRGNLQELIGTALSFPGIAGLLGGSPLALGQGAYAMASSGMGINGAMMMGDGPLQLLAARAMTQRLTNQFYTASGAANTSMTSGLNRDQLGGIMMMAAGQGAFAGLNMGSLTKVGNATSFQLDENTMSKLTQFTKSAAKALAGLIDIYGDASVAELAQKAHQITGLDFSRIGNASLMANRLAQIRTAASGGGIDAQTAMDLAASGTLMGNRMGLTPALAGAIAARSIGPSTAMFQGFRQAGNLFDMAQPSLQEINAGQMRDMAAMVRDPIGIRRMALLSLISSGNLKGGVADEAKTIMAGTGIGAGMEMEAFMKRATGMDMRSYIELMGGSTGLQHTLSEDQRQELINLNETDVSERASRVYRMKLSRTLGAAGGAGPGIDALIGLSENIRPAALEKIFSAGAFNAADVRKALMGDAMGSLDPERFTGMVGKVFDQFGGDSLGRWRMVEQSRAADPVLMAHSAKMSIQADQALARNNLVNFTDEDRGFMRSGFFDALLNRMRGTDPRSNWVRAMMYAPGSIHGWKQDWNLPTNMDQPGAVEMMKKTLGAMADSDLGSSEPGKTLLKELGLARNSGGAYLDEGQVRKMFTQIQGGLMGVNTLFRNYTVAGGLGGSMVLGENAALKRMNPVLDLATSLALGFGQSGNYQVRDQLIKARELMIGDPERTEQAVKMMIARSKDVSLLSKFSDKELQVMAPASQAWSGEMIKYLDSVIADGTTPGKTLAQAKRIRDVLATAGASNREDTSKVTRLEGELHLVGSTLKFEKGRLVVTEGGKK